MGFIWFLVILTIVVFVHELGHYWAARRSGVVVEIFSLGFGPELLGYTDSRGTRWKLSLLLLGGYIKMAGEPGVIYASTEASVPPEDSIPPEAFAPPEEEQNIPGSFHSASLKAKTFIVAMGPIANFILGIVIIAAIYISFGKVITPTIVGGIESGSAAEIAGLEIGDEIQTVDGKKVSDFSALRNYIFESPGRPLLLTVERDGRIINLNVIPETIDDKCIGVSYGRLGVIGTQGELKTLGPIESLTTASVDSFVMAKTMLRAIGRLVTGNANKGEIGGPVKIAEISGRVANQGLISFAFFVAALSINLGLVNLLPIPAFDGGHLTLFGVQAVTGKPIPPKIQDRAMRIGMALLIFLMVLVTFFDVTNLFISEC